MTDPHAKNALHGITLEMMLTQMVDYFGWEELGRQIDIRCFTCDPSIASSLKFLRRTPWARDKTESLYSYMLSAKTRQSRQGDTNDL